MNNIDPAGAAAAALNTRPVQIPTENLDSNVTPRPVIESVETAPPVDVVSQASSGNTRLGSIIDTTA